MKKTRSSESQIIKVLKEVEGGRTVKAVCREYGVAEGTYYTWKSKYGGMGVADLKRLKELEGIQKIYPRSHWVGNGCLRLIDFLLC